MERDRTLGLNRGDAIKIDGQGGIAWRIRGFTEDGFVVAVMVGDDRPSTFDPEEVTLIDEDEFCGCCGQFGCRWDGR